MKLDTKYSKNINFGKINLPTMGFELISVIQFKLSYSRLNIKSATIF